MNQFNKATPILHAQWRKMIQTETTDNPLSSCRMIPKEGEAGSNNRGSREKKRKHESRAQRKMDEEKAAVFDSISRRDWQQLRKMLRSKNGRTICSYRDSTNLNILGMALGMRPPHDIVELILAYNPHLVHERDDLGAVPLHLGCLNGISLEILKLIISIDGGVSARVQDSDNRTALHHAVEYNCVLADWDDDSTMLSIIYEESLEVIELLLTLVPETVTCVTQSGDCPLDIPHIVKNKLGCDHHPKLDEVYRLLKATSIDLYKQKKKGWELAGYDVRTAPQDCICENAPSVASSNVSCETYPRKLLNSDLDKMSL